MAKPNYQYEKRQKELAKKAKQEEKRRQKLKDAGTDGGQKPPASESDATSPEPSQK